MIIMNTWPYSKVRLIIQQKNQFTNINNSVWTCFAKYHKYLKKCKIEET